MSGSASSCDSSISANFNGTRIAAGTTIWFTAAMKVSGVGSSPVTINVSQSSIAFNAGGTPYSVTVPNAAIAVNPGGGAATITSGASGWSETVPYPFSGNVLLEAVQLPVSAGLPGGIQNVTWSGHFTSTQQGLTMHWAWSAAVYSQFSTDYNALGVKPVDANDTSQYSNSDLAGTPENYKAYVIGGAMGGGGSNYTGGLSGTESVSLCRFVAPKIYVTSYNGILSTYNADGTPSTPTFTGEGLANPRGVTLDASGKIYVGNFGAGTITTYNQDGSPASPTITGLSGVQGVAVDKSGKIYATNLFSNRVTTYNADGSQAALTIATRPEP